MSRREEKFQSNLAFLSTHLCVFDVLYMHPSFLFRQIVILFNLRFSSIRFSLRLNARCSPLFLFTISIT